MALASITVPTSVVWVCSAGAAPLRRWLILPPFPGAVFCFRWQVVYFGPAVRPLQRLMEFLFKTPADRRRDPLNAINAALPLAKILAGGTLIDAGDAD